MTTYEEKNNDVVKVAPGIHTILFENNIVRVLKISIKPGEAALMHWHPENMNYILTSGKLRFTRPDGSVNDVALIMEQVTASSAGSHKVENIGTTEVQTVQVEFKE